MVWNITFSRKAAKQAKALAEREKGLLALLVREMALGGPVRGDWPNYSKLGKDTHHCHLNPKWVACWIVADGKLKLIEIYNVGSRKDAPY